jgi:hypothetical protein
MDENDRAAIEGLFERLNAAGRCSATRDPKAEALIDRRMAQTPGAAYCMAQTIIVQEHALARAEERIAELEVRLAESGRVGGFLAGLFGDNGRPSPVEARSDRVRPADRMKEPISGRVGLGARAPGDGTGFLGSAAQTAMGVAGGVLIANAVAGLWGYGAAAGDFDGLGPEQDLDDLGDLDGGGFDL